ncbi:DUF645 family protein [Vibrio cholerae]|nr:DUF645 family protein [Vibrio cholerae]EGR2241059.1 DUF645 family protein [Vibrio cholerae]EII3728986.1 DUF645 family protein [Vibrio cholerae]EJK2108221.1 DUF645 family protein [Vibrio cholerae]EKF9197591.1 DUF645 family protein [Vibrio cholerae]
MPTSQLLALDVCLLDASA